MQYVLSQGVTPPYMKISRMLFACLAAGSIELAFADGVSPNRASPLARRAYMPATAAVTPPAAVAIMKSRRFIQLSVADLAIGRVTILVGRMLRSTSAKEIGHGVCARHSV